MYMHLFSGTNGETQTFDWTYALAGEYTGTYTCVTLFLFLAE